jgi:hypothetical protein
MSAADVTVRPRIPERLPDRSELQVGEQGGVDRPALVAQVMDLRAEGPVVHDHEQNRDPVADGGVEVPQGEHQAAVADHRHSHAIGPAQRGADRGSHPEADRAELGRVDEAAGIGHRHLDAGIAHEVPGIDDQGPFPWQHPVDPAGELGAAPAPILAAPAGAAPAPACSAARYSAMARVTSS